MVVGDVGKTIQLNTGADQTGKTVYIFFCKPDGTTGTWAATVNSEDPAIIEYKTVAGDIDQANERAVYWTIRSFIGGVKGGLVRPTVESACGK